MGPDEFTAGTTLSLDCSVMGNTLSVTYQWTRVYNFTPMSCSNCNETKISTTHSQTVGKPLYSYHAGVYTCIASEDGKPDSTNNGSFTIKVVGELYHRERIIIIDLWSSNYII